jgi:uncharacterized protein
MQEKYTLKVSPSEAADDTVIKKLIAGHAGRKPSDITGWHVLKRSIDARSRSIWISLTLQAYINEPFQERKHQQFHFKDVTHSGRKVIIIGAGPAGLFAALYLLEQGIQPVILERGKDIRLRRRDLAALNKEGVINPDSNYCFGEGGAGTYSDGKLYTRSNKRGNIDRILQLFVEFGAEEKILYEAHPHIGTNKLPHIITAMRERIIECGGKVLFDKRVTDFTVIDAKITSIKTADGDTIEAEDVILATGHSARDIFYLLDTKKLKLEAKPFALGVRAEHPQQLIDKIQYHCDVRDEYLPPSSYSLVEQVEERGVFSFCMCPGGIIAPAATNDNEVVVNGWSPSKRNNPFANSGIVVQVDIADAVGYFKRSNIPYDEASPLMLMQFQRAIEEKAFEAGGGKFVAPAQRLFDFVSNKTSATLPDCSYLPGIASADIREVLPPFISKALQQGFKRFGRKLTSFDGKHSYLTNDAVIVGVESRTSSPVRIPRDSETLSHPQVDNLYPCGEGAGYAGGIVSAAMDGERIAAMITSKSST